jgi:hypothetical protein
MWRRNNSGTLFAHSIACGQSFSGGAEEKKIKKIIYFYYYKIFIAFSTCLPVVQQLVLWNFFFGVLIFRIVH